MATLLFDKMFAARKLEGDGLFTRTQAETLAEVYHDAMTESAATKTDLEMLGNRLDSKISALHTKIVLWMAAMFVAAGALQHYFK